LVYLSWIKEKAEDGLIIGRLEMFLGEMVFLLKLNIFLSVNEMNECGLIFFLLIS